VLSHTRSLHIWCTVFHARQKRTASLRLASRLLLPSSSIFRRLCRVFRMRPAVCRSQKDGRV
jgi:hypothetical protein